MIQKADGYSKLRAHFYKQYAQENQLDFLQLLILDLLDQAGGKITWFVLFGNLTYSNLQIRQTIQELEEQDLVVSNFDFVCLSEYAPFVIDEILQDLHAQYEAFIMEMPESSLEQPFLQA